MSSPPASPRPRFDRRLVEGSLPGAVWRLAWPTILQNALGGLQGLVDHAMVGHYVGFIGNAAIGVSWQVFLVVVVFIASLYAGMGVLVARFSGAGDADKVDRVVHQALVQSVVLAVLILAPLGYFLSPALLHFVNATPEVRMEALPYLRIMFVFSVGMLLFYLLSGALRAAGDARTPLRLGVLLTVLNVGLNLILIPGLGPIPALGTTGAALGTVLASLIVAAVGLALLYSHRLVVRFTRGTSWRPDWDILRTLFRFGLPVGFQGVAMNVAGVLLLRFVGSLQHSAEAQAAYAVGYTQLFSLVTWTSFGLMSAAGAIAGQNLGAGRPDRSVRGVRIASGIGIGIATVIGLLFVTVPEALLAFFGMREPIVVMLGTQLLGYLSLSGFFIAVALTFTGGLQGTGDTRSPLYITLISQILIPIGLLSVLTVTRGLEPPDIWGAIVLGHFTRCMLTVLKFRQGKWKKIQVDIGMARA